ncbi:MAG: hypothetical protein CL885_04575 [Dehalococcoidia bacterium]|nr:hypothetical protein [Dehalococcoidia bacterium]
MINKRKLNPGSYAIIRWESTGPEVICEILGYRSNMMIVRTEHGEERVINPKSAQIIGLREISNDRY